MPGIQKGKPHRITPARMAQLERWRQMGAQARRGKHIALKQSYHRKRAKRGTSVTKTLAKSAAWGTQKMVVPVGLAGPITPIIKNRIPGYNQAQIVKSTAHRASRGKHTGRLG
jgi:hypothetical protein